LQRRKKTLTDGKVDRTRKTIDRRSIHKRGKLPVFPNITGENRSNR
jgi:hypothetical protein